MARRRRNRHPLLNQAAANADLRYAPEESGLQALLGQASEEYATDKRTISGTTATAVRGARKSIPQLRRIYNQAATGVKAAQSDIDQAFNQAGVTPDNAFKLASEVEGTAYRQRMTWEAAQAARQARTDIRQAKLGKVFALGAARDRFNDTVRQLNQRSLDLAGERQSFLVSELGRLRSEKASRQTQLDVAATQQGINPQTGKPYPGGKADEQKFKPASRDDLKEFTTLYQRAIKRAQDSAQGGDTREQAMDKMLNGRKSITVEKGGKKYTLPALDKITDQLAVRAALDMAYRGSITAATRRKMRDERGFRVNDLDNARFIANRKRRKRVAGATQQQITANQGAQIPVVGGILGLG